MGKANESFNRMMDQPAALLSLHTSRSIVLPAHWTLRFHARRVDRFLAPCRFLSRDRWEDFALITVALRWWLKWTSCVGWYRCRHRRVCWRLGERFSWETSRVAATLDNCRESECTRRTFRLRMVSSRVQWLMLANGFLVDRVEVHRCLSSLLVQSIWCHFLTGAL